MGLYWYGHEDWDGGIYVKLCEACAQRQCIADLEDGAAEGYCEACGWSAALELSLEPSAEFYEA